MTNLQHEIHKVFALSPVPLKRDSDTVVKVAQGVIRRIAPGALENPTHTLEITVDDITVNLPVNLMRLQVLQCLNS